MLSSMATMSVNWSYKPSLLTNSHFMGRVKFNDASTIRTPIIAASAQAIETETPLQSQKLGVVVKPMEKPRLVLKFIWMEKNIGIALDQVIPGYGTIPVSPYYFWPRKDAWEELKIMLESKPWISQRQMVVLLNQATDIINLWQQSGGDTQ